MSESASSITFWECAKGIKLDYFSPKSLTFYKTVNAVYNHKEFYANLQLDDSVSGTKFNFKDGLLWKKMDEGILMELADFNKSLSLSFPTINPYQTEQNIESSLAALLSDYRAKLKLSYNYDDVLANLLSTALANYEI
jgi:centrosomal protein CEP76